MNFITLGIPDNCFVLSVRRGLRGVEEEGNYTEGATLLTKKTNNK